MLQKVFGLIFILLASNTSIFALVQSSKPARETIEALPEIWFPNKILYRYSEQGGNGLFYFWFKNVGDAPLIITKATGSGGSTAPYFDREPVQPEKWGLIKIRYDTKRLGPYSRVSTIHSNDPGGLVTLKMKGIIRPIAKGKSTQNLPRVEKTQLFCQKLVLNGCKNGTISESYLSVYNSDSIPHAIVDITLSDSLFGKIEYLFRPTPVVIPPNKTTKILFRIRTHFRTDLDTTSIQLRTDENLAEPFVITKVHGFSNTAEYAQIKFDSTMLHRNYHYAGPCEFSFFFENVGTIPLIISNVRYSGGTGIRSYPKAPIMPGERGEIKMSYNTRREGPFHKSITVVTNGHFSPTVVRIKGVVKSNSR